MVSGAPAQRLVGTLAAIARFVRLTGWQGMLVALLIVVLFVVGVRLVNHG
jgi:hypothetical protein